MKRGRRVHLPAGARGLLTWRARGSQSDGARRPARNTRFPARYLWGPGNRAQAIAWFKQASPEPDSCDYLDQIFLVRVHDDRVHLPMYPSVAASLPPLEQQGTWHAVRADGPTEVFSHARAVAATVTGHARTGECSQCPVQTIASGDIGFGTPRTASNASNAWGDSSLWRSHGSAPRSSTGWPSFSPTRRESRLAGPQSRQPVDEGRRLHSLRHSDGLMYQSSPEAPPVRRW